VTEPCGYGYEFRVHPSQPTDSCHRGCFPLVSNESAIKSPFMPTLATFFRAFELTTMSAPAPSVTASASILTSPSLPSTELGAVQIVPRAVAAASDPSTTSSFSSTTSSLAANSLFNPLDPITTFFASPPLVVAPETGSGSIPVGSSSGSTTSSLGPASVSNLTGYNVTESALPTGAPGSVAPETRSGLTPVSPGGITGIVFGIVFFLAVIFVLACWQWWRPRVRRRAAKDITDDSTALKSQDLEKSHVNTNLKSHDV
jgi:hypothetical protein